MDFHCRSRGHKPKKDEGVPCKKWALIEFLFLLCMGHFKSTKLCLASNRNSLRCDYVCENKDDVWVHKRVSFLSKDFSDQRSQIGQKICSNLHFLNKIFFCQVHIPAEKLVECGDCVWVGDRLDNIRFLFRFFYVLEFFLRVKILVGC